jgi:predicted TIM-barrel fold metal-dependent hydrolase
MQTCGATSLGLRRALERIGPERILYASDGGFGDPKLIDYNIQKIRGLSLPADQEAMVFSGNADRLLKRKTRT